MTGIIDLATPTPYYNHTPLLHPPNIKYSNLPQNVSFRNLFINAEEDKQSTVEPTNHTVHYNVQSL